MFRWRKGDPVQVAKNMHLPRFVLEKYEADVCNSVTNTGTSPLEPTGASIAVPVRKGDAFHLIPDPKHRCLFYRHVSFDCTRQRSAEKSAQSSNGAKKRGEMTAQY